MLYPHFIMQVHSIFESLLDWDLFSVRIKEAEVHNLPKVRCERSGKGGGGRGGRGTCFYFGEGHGSHKFQAVCELECMSSLRIDSEGRMRKGGAGSEPGRICRRAGGVDGSTPPTHTLIMCIPE